MHPLEKTLNIMLRNINSLHHGSRSASPATIVNLQMWQHVVFDGNVAVLLPTETSGTVPAVFRLSRNPDILDSSPPPSETTFASTRSGYCVRSA